MRLEYQDSIDRYLLNRMSDEERTSFEAKCAENPELKEQLEHTQNVRKVITERNELLSKIQEWDDEYDAKKETGGSNVRLWIFGLSGIAAVFVVGFFLFSQLKVSEPKGTGALVSMNGSNDRIKDDSTVVSPIEKHEENEQLLAKNEPEKKDSKVDVVRTDDEQVLSFGKSVIVTESSNPTGANDKELEKVLEDKREVSKKMAELEQERASGEIDQVVYETTVSLLKHQRDHLCWREVTILLSMNQKKEAMAILDELRKVEGRFQHRADSLYNELRK